MLRVGFLFQGSAAWLGGVNYLRNLLFAIRAHAPMLEPVIVAAPDAELHGLDALAEVSRALPPVDALFPRTLRRRVLGRDDRIEALVRALRLDVVSHSGTFGWRFPVPTLPWIPDFQHRRLPQNFAPKERAIRAYEDITQLVEGTRTIVSSAAAQADCRRYYGPLARKTRVLRFVSQPSIDLAALPTREALREKYALPEEYLFLPNQLWRHKNHTVVVDALRILAGRGHRPTVVMTGKTEDYRAPQYAAWFAMHVASSGVERQMPHLGVVPYADLSALMRDAMAVINPSHFEGWSTTVEEARSLGKATLLSDIDVHREQAPPGARYFPADDPDALAALLEHELADDDARRAREASASLGERTQQFAETYTAIVGEALASAATIR